MPRGKPRAAIFYPDQDRRAITLGSNVQATTLGHGFERVVNQVQKNSLHSLAFHLHLQSLRDSV